MTDRLIDHVPVLLAECLEYLRPSPGETFIDCTINGGGHSAAILEKTAPDGRLLGIDADSGAVERAQERFAHLGTRVLVRHSNFRHLQRVVAETPLQLADGVLIDLGFSSQQIDGAGRGFSFGHDDPLDMRFDQTDGLSAADFLADSDEIELERVLRTYGEEPQARRIARWIVRQQVTSPVQTTGELATMVSRAVGGRQGRIHPATRTFQALRIKVNDELGALEDVLPQAVEVLRPGGRLGVIAFHSLEDRAVKQFMRRRAGLADDEGPRHLPPSSSAVAPSLRIVTRRPLTASPDEIARNPRSRSARLRVAERL